jgi:hypothetical protein
MVDKIIKNNFLVVSDYNWLPENICESWIGEATDDYLIYDRFHRPEWEESDKLIKQKNVGQNVYDIFDFIVTNYDNLPNNTIFCRSAFLFPKDTGTPRLNEKGEKLSTGNCSKEHFFKLANNTTFTELHDFGPEVHDGYASRMGPDGSFLEINNSWFAPYGTRKYYYNTNTFLQDMYVDPIIPIYIRFSPGANYIIPKDNILKYSKKFYERIREILSHDIIVTEAYILERCIYTIFTCDWEVKEIYK